MLYAKVWYTNNDDDIAGPFLLPDETGIDLFVRDMINCGWYKAEIGNESGKVTHTIIQTPDENWEVKENQ